jgi:membrane-associated PAP2 superfamily phosphatase
MSLIGIMDLDRRVATAWFFDADAWRWIGAKTWWADTAIHGGGAAIVWAVGLAALGVLAGGLASARLRAWRRGAAFIAISILLCAATVGILKLATNVDCPRDLAGFGGDRPYVALFTDRPDELPRAACFPGSHSSTGFSLVAFYFLFLGTRPRLARRLLAAALALGGLYAFAQEARGAHFLSHDITSVALDWYLELAVWGLLTRSQAGTRLRLIPDGRSSNPRRRDHHATGLPACAACPQTGRIL